MSEMDFPFVSGTKMNVKTVPITLSTAKPQKVSPMPIAFEIEPNVSVMMKARPQLKAPVIGLAMALYSFE